MFNTIKNDIFASRGGRHARESAAKVDKALDFVQERLIKLQAIENFLKTNKVELALDTVKRILKS